MRQVSHVDEEDVMENVSVHGGKILSMNLHFILAKGLFDVI